MKEEKELRYMIKNQPAIKAYISQDSIWLATEDIAKLYQTPLHLVLHYIKRIYQTDSMSEFLTMQRKRVLHQGKVQLVTFYNLQMILAIGTQIQAEETSVFYKWAVHQLKNQDEKVRSSS